MAKDKKNLVHNPANAGGFRVQRASLSALVKRRIYNDNEYPAQILHILDNQIQAKLMPPIVRSMRQDHTEIDVDSVLPVKGSGLKEGAPKMNCNVQFVIL